VSPRSSDYIIIPSWDVWRVVVEGRSARMYQHMHMYDFPADCPHRRIINFAFKRRILGGSSI
jgi:hypothetical protein